MNTASSIKPAATHALFAKYGLRFTRQRRVLYEALASTDAHPTADELFRSHTVADHKLSLATVYNTLEAFCEAGMAQKLPGKGGSARYDAAVHEHVHLRSRETGEVSDAPESLSRVLIECLPKDAIERIETEFGFKIDQVQIELVGEFAKARQAAD